VLVGTGVLRYAVVAVCVTVAFGMTDISTVDFVGGRRASASAGVVLAIWSVGSMIGGLLFGATDGTVTDRVLAKVVAIVGGGLALASLSPGSIGLAAILFASGMAVAPMMARLYARMATAAGDASKTEAFGWLAVGFLIGTSLGSAVGGLSIDAVGARWTFLFAGAAALCAVPVLVLRRQVTSLRVR
jgi:predicted MFS family arabinose efflux permease